MNDDTTMHLHSSGRFPAWIGPVLATVLSACAAPTPEPRAAAMPDPAEIVTEPASLTITAGGSALLAAQANDSRGMPIGGALLKFSAADAGLIAVDAHGHVVALGRTGNTAVRVTSGPREHSVPVTIHAAAPRRIALLEGAGQVVTAGEAAPHPVRVQALDAFGNAVPGVAVQLRRAQRQGALAAGTTGADGQAALAIPPLERAGMQLLEVAADADGRPHEDLRITVRPAAVAEVLARSLPQTRPAAGVPADLILELRDAFGNPVPDTPVRLQASGGAGTIAPAEVLSASDGTVRARWSAPRRAPRQATLSVQVGAGGGERSWPLPAGDEARPRGR